MLIILVITLVLAGLRLWGETSQVYKTVSHVFVGGLSGYTVGVHNWLVILCALILVGVEIYSFASKYFPAIALSNLFKGVTTPKK